jgi:tellurite resistance protein TerC
MFEQSILMWGSFFAVVLALLAFDLGVLNKKDHEIGIRESLIMSAFYIAMGLLFGGWVAYNMGVEKAQLYYTGFVVEKALSLDNVFVISMVFTYFAIPRIYQHRVLFWGILGAIVMRGIMIGLGAALIHQFSWILFFFGAFLLYTGIKMFSMVDHEPDIASNPILKLLHKYFHVTKKLYGHDFFAKEPDPKNPSKLVWHMTPLFAALVVVEFVDVIFAVDSVPAIFAITTDPYIVMTSNIFAILGLRALYFALAAMVHRFHYLKYALAMVLIFIGAKILFIKIFDYHEMPPVISLTVTFGLIIGGVLYSLYKTNDKVEKV